MVPYSFRSVLLLLLLTAAMTAGVMDVEYSWIYADYTYGSLQQRESAIRSGKFIPENCVILDVDVFQGTSEDRLYFNSGGPGSSLPKKRIFVSVPRIKPGNPASLAVLVPEDSKPPLLAPFPSWKFHFLSEDRPDCDNSIISVFRMKIDDLGRLWVVDTGRINQFELHPRSICPPKLLIFDLKNGDKIIRSYTFPPEQYKQDSLFTNIIVDFGDQKGRNTFAYITDTTAYKLLVYDFRNDESWVVDQLHLYPYPHKGHFNINGVTFGLMDGILGLALGPPTRNNRKLYFHAFASVRESWVYTSTLQNKTLFASGLIDGQGLFFTSPDVRPTQSSVEVMTNDGILFSAMMDNSLVCWNSEDSFLPENIPVVYKSDRDFQFPSGMKIVGDRIWVVSNQLQNHFTTLVNDRSSIKYRVLVGRVDDLIRGTGCDKRFAPIRTPIAAQKIKPPQSLVFSGRGG
ncbi:protein yellow-like isoform X1 [Adelges cooleyi]|uniref:protein yellow-like isoform X1 n=1 Tax=Adelges cooleyi TaxID=133065 RepID=UPI00217FFD77|nr:protein yellow-like isoform X1 [Adelges cooleyi]XP_050432425.1 protein yellow-like isoform X1 [Adelges cooleyi]